MSFDVAIVGAGPAGSALANACAQRGLNTVLIDPCFASNAMPIWPNTYSAWRSSLVATPAASHLASEFQSVTVCTPTAQQIDAQYVRLNNAALAEELIGSQSFHTDTRSVSDVLAHPSEAELAQVLFSNGTSIDATLVVDCSGRGLVLDTTPNAEQQAFGIVAQFDINPIEPGSCVLMDWSDPGVATDGPPTFLYAMDVSGQQYGANAFLMEETVLATKAPVDYDRMKQRLYARFERRGCQPINVIHQEEVRIPLDIALPKHQPLISFGTTRAPVVPLARFGTAAGLVNPITGYSLATSLNLAPNVAAVIADELHVRQNDHTRSASDLVERVHQSIWTRSARESRRIENYGLNILCNLDQTGAQQFFHDFFALPANQWLPFLTGRSGVLQTTKTMLNMFRKADWSSRRAVLPRLRP